MDWDMGAAEIKTVQDFYKLKAKLTATHLILFKIIKKK